MNHDVVESRYIAKIVFRQWGATAPLLRIARFHSVAWEQVLYLADWLLHGRVPPRDAVDSTVSWSPEAQIYKDVLGVVRMHVTMAAGQITMDELLASVGESS